MKGLDLISAAMRTAGVLEAGELPSGAQSANFRVLLNQMLEAWGAEKLNVFTLTRNGPFNFVASQQAYTVGTGGNFNIPRPAKIEYVSYVYNANPAQPLETQIAMYSDEDWLAIPIKNILNVLPEGVYDDGGFPLRTLNYWPIPNDSSVQTIIGAWTALNQFTNLSTDFTFPPGYIDAMQYELAIRIGIEFGKEPSPTVVSLALKAMARIKTMNITPLKMKIDPIVSTGNGGHYDWRTDTYK